MNLLVATEFPPNASGGGPAVVRQMLKNWPVEKLCWWSCLPEAHGQFGQRVQKHACAVIPRKCYPSRKWTSAEISLSGTPLDALGRRAFAADPAGIQAGRGLGHSSQLEHPAAGQGVERKSGRAIT